jgi:hypothetical protein
MKFLIVSKNSGCKISLNPKTMTIPVIIERHEPKISSKYKEIFDRLNDLEGALKGPISKPKLNV